MDNDWDMSKPWFPDPVPTRWDQFKEVCFVLGCTAIGLIVAVAILYWAYLHALEIVVTLMLAVVAVIVIAAIVSAIMAIALAIGVILSL